MSLAAASIHEADDPAAEAEEYIKLINALFGCGIQALRIDDNGLPAPRTVPDPKHLWPALIDPLFCGDWDLDRNAPRIKSTPFQGKLYSTTCLVQPLLGSTRFSTGLQGPLLGVELRSGQGQPGRFLGDYELRAMGITADAAIRRSLHNMEQATPKQLTCGHIADYTPTTGVLGVLVGKLAILRP